MRVPQAREPVQAADTRQVRETVERIVADVRERGDAAVRAYSATFDAWSPESFRLTDEDVGKRWPACRSRSRPTTCSR
jgi:sulfopropanediol 3-dehydrogenase